MKTLIHTILIVAGVALIPQAFADLECHLCLQEIEGRYVEYKGQGRFVRVCKPCNTSQPKCNACRVPHRIQQLKSIQGERLCSTCEAKAKYCTMCKHRIDGRYYQIRGESEDQLFCNRCYHFSRKCEVCRLPKARNELDPRSGACADCLPNLPTCKSCDAKITGTYFEYQFADGQFCSQCKRTRPECYVCNVPVGQRFFRFPDGRKVCSDCNADSVSDPRVIREIMDEVQEYLEIHLGMKIENPYTLHVEELSHHSFQARRGRDGNDDFSPLFGRELGLYRYHNGKSEIYILYGLPREMLYETAAHELAHAWQIENCPLEQSLNLKEGFAQWVAAYMLKSRGYDKAFAKLEARNDYPYGTGYKRVQAVFEQKGLQGLFTFVKTATR